MPSQDAAGVCVFHHIDDVLLLDPRSCAPSPPLHMPEASSVWRPRMALVGIDATTVQNQTMIPRADWRVMVISTIQMTKGDCLYVPFC